MGELPPDAEHRPVDPARRRRIIADRKLQAAKARYTAQRTPLERLSDAVVAAAASPRFLVLHVLWFLLWLALNAFPSVIPPFDPFPFGLLTMIVSLEAICLSIFILMSQNRDAAIAELRAEVTLEVSLRIEEKLTKNLQLLTGMYGRLGLQLADDPDLQRMLLPLDTTEIERELSSQIRPAPRPRVPR